MANTISAQSLSNHQKHLATLAALEAQGDMVRLEPAIIAAARETVSKKHIPHCHLPYQPRRS